MKAYTLKKENSGVADAIRHYVGNETLNQIEVAELGETLYRQTVHTGATGYLTYEPVTHKAVFLSGMQCGKSYTQELEKEIAELKKNQGVVWKKGGTMGTWASCPLDDAVITVCHKKMVCTIPLPAPEKDEAEEAYRKEFLMNDFDPITDTKEFSHYTKGFNAGKEIK